MLSVWALFTVPAYINQWAQVLASEGASIPPAPAVPLALCRDCSMSPQRAGIKVLLKCRVTVRFCMEQAQLRITPLLHTKCETQTVLHASLSVFFSISIFPVISGELQWLLGWWEQNLLRLRWPSSTGEATCVCTIVPKFGTLWAQYDYCTTLTLLSFGLQRRPVHVPTTLLKTWSVSSKAEMTFPILGEMEGCWAVT